MFNPQVKIKMIIHAKILDNIFERFFKNISFYNKEKFGKNFPSNCMYMNLTTTKIQILYTNFKSFTEVNLERLKYIEIKDSEGNYLSLDDNAEIPLYMSNKTIKQIYKFVKENKNKDISFEFDLINNNYKMYSDKKSTIITFETDNFARSHKDIYNKFIAIHEEKVELKSNFAERFFHYNQSVVNSEYNRFYKFTVDVTKFKTFNIMNGSMCYYSKDIDSKGNIYSELVNMYDFNDSSSISFLDDVTFDSELVGSCLIQNKIKFQKIELENCDYVNSKGIEKILSIKYSLNESDFIRTVILPML